MLLRHSRLTACLDRQGSCQTGLLLPPPRLPSSGLGVASISFRLERALVAALLSKTAINRRHGRGTVFVPLLAHTSSPATGALSSGWFIRCPQRHSPFPQTSHVICPRLQYLIVETYWKFFFDTLFTALYFEYPDRPRNSEDPELVTECWLEPVLKTFQLTCCMVGHFLEGTDVVHVTLGPSPLFCLPVD